jgi:restriction endonuclease S subunit
VQKGEIEGRFDPDMILYNRKTLRFNFPVKQLKQLLRAKPQYGSNQAGIDRNSIHEARYIRITDIDEYGLLKNNLGVTAEFIEEKHTLKNNDLLFARSGATVGKAYLHTTDSVNYECFYAGYMIRFLVNENLLLSKFLFCYTQLEVYKEWVKAIQRAAGQPNINAEEYKSLSVPVPSLETQIQIINIFETAYNSKKQKEAEAAELLASIDDYLLEQLGITLPPQTEKKTSFITHFNQLSGGRFDPYYHQSEFKELEISLKTGRYPIKSFNKLAKKITSGATPTSGGNDYTSRDLGIPFIRSGEINEFDEVDFNSVIYIKPIVHNKTLKSSQLKKNDLMIAIVGATIGQVGIFKYDFEANINQAIALIRFDNSVNVEFVKSFLKTTIGQKVLDKLKRPVARANINLEEISSIQIPLPPIEKQEEIAAHISRIRARAKQLQQQAADALEQAKQSVEKMILGD